MAEQESKPSRSSDPSTQQKPLSSQTEAALSWLAHEGIVSLHRQKEEICSVLEHALLDLEGMKKHLELDKEKAAPSFSSSKQTLRNHTATAASTAESDKPEAAPSTASKEKAGMLGKIKRWVLG